MDNNRWYTFCDFHKENRLAKEVGTWIRNEDTDTCDYNTRKGRCGAECRWEFYPGAPLGSD